EKKRGHGSTRRNTDQVRSRGSKTRKEESIERQKRNRYFCSFPFNTPSASPSVFFLVLICVNPCLSVAHFFTATAAPAGARSPAPGPRVPPPTGTGSPVPGNRRTTPRCASSAVRW